MRTAEGGATHPRADRTVEIPSCDGADVAHIATQIRITSQGNPERRLISYDLLGRTNLAVGLQEAQKLHYPTSAEEQQMGPVCVYAYT